MYFFLPVSVSLLAYLGYGDYMEARQIGDKQAIRYQLQSLVLMVVILVLAAYIYREYPIYSEYLGFFKEDSLNQILVIAFSFAISYLWFLFFRALDIFESEKLGPLLLLFLLACASTMLVYPIGHLWNALGCRLNDTFIKDFLYCFIRIGFTEEFAKILPFLLLLWFSKNIDEPYDYILYGGVCALGFAFVENIQYLSSSNLMLLAGRSLYSTVGHVFDTSIICYFLALAKYKNSNAFIAFLKGFLLAALAHGFYDFWLISKAYNFYLATLFFFLMSVHFLTLMINNLLNISPYFKTERRLRTARYKFYLTTYLIILCVLGFVAILFSSGQEQALEFARSAALYQSYTMTYLVISFTSLNVVHGYLMPIKQPKNIFLPLINAYPNYLDLPVELNVSGRHNAKAAELLKMALPMDLILSKRVVVEGNFNWYYLSGANFPEEWKTLGHQLIVSPIKYDEHLRSGKPQYCRLAIIKNERALGQVVLDPKDLRPLGNSRIQYKREAPSS